jgi:PAS domain S-box-containing protein
VTDLLPDPWREALLESSLDCVIIMDAAGLIVDFNNGTAETFGLDRQGTIGRRLGDVFVPPELRARHSAGLARYLATGDSRILGTRVEVQALHASGRRLPVELSIVRLRGTDPPLFVGHLRTIEARLRSQRRLRVSAGVHAVLASESDVDAAVRETLFALGKALDWVCVQFWSATENPAGVTLRAWWDRPDPSIDLTQFRRIDRFAPGIGLPGTVLTTGEPSWIEDLATAANFPRIKLAVAAGFRTGIALPIHVRGRVVAVIEAFSREREARDEELLRLLDALGSQLGHFIEESGIRAERDAMLVREQKANRLKDEFLAVISHELRTPLSPIVGWARMLLAQPSTPTSMRTGLESIERNALLQTQLVEDLLDVSSIIAGKLTIAPVRTEAASAIMASAETVRAAAADKRIQLSVDAPVGLPAVLADPRRLQQILSNVLSNAVKFTPEGGNIAVTAREAGGMLDVAVRDSGMGIDRAFLPRVFDRFRQEDARSTRASGGLGLGLSIVQDLVIAHGGTVQVVSEGAGRGTTVMIRLPLYQISPTVKPSGNGS